MAARVIHAGKRSDTDHWLKQAENDLEFARLGLREEFFAQACFWAQQCAEKAVKGIGRLVGDRAVLENSVAHLVDRHAERAPGLSDLMDESRLLDRYYRATRYPDATGPIPYAVFGEGQAIAAIEAAERFVRLAGEHIRAGGG